MGEETDATTGLEQLEVDRWGTRFLQPDVEAAYRRWNLERAAGAFQAGLRASTAFWIVSLLVIWIARPAGSLAWTLAIGAVLAVIAWMWLSLRARSVRALELSSCVGVAISGSVGIALAELHLGSPTLAIAATVWSCFFHLRAVGIRPSRTALAVVPYLVLEACFLWLDVRAGHLDAFTAVFAVFIVITAVGMGLMGAITDAAASHHAFRQERIIEAQGAIIAREHARSAALLKQELGHQVAERSRELGAVLSKLEVSLDVRQLSPGERFDARYRVVSRLGAGGMGAVYEVERVTDGQRLALKAIIGEVSGATAARFAREAEIGARVHHPNLVSIVDVGISAGVPFLVMELVRGAALEGRRARFGDPAWALPVLRQIADGLAALHDAGVVHRDLKPANVLLEGDEDAPIAKISDFGISRFGAIEDHTSIDPSAPTIGANPSPKSPALTGTGVLMGTPLYMAPEAARGARAIEFPADVFAFGIIAYEALTGRAPFAVPAVLLALAEQPTPTAPPIDDERIPAPLCAAILDCLSGDPARRPRVRALLSMFL